jgi:ankyrin repeat protein
LGKIIAHKEEIVDMFYIAIMFIAIMFIAIAAVTIFAAVSYFKKRRVFRERGKHTTAKVIDIDRSDKSRYIYTLEYMVDCEFQIAECIVRVCNVHEVEETVEIAYLPEHPERVMLAEHLAKTTANKVLKAFVVVECVLILVLVTFNVKEIIEQGSREAFLELCRSGTPQQIEAKIKSGAYVNAKDNSSETPLMLAASNNKNPEVLRVLIQAGAYVNAKDNSGETPLMLAASNNKNPEVLRVLIQASADVNAKNNFSTTSLMRAAQRNSAEAVDILIKAGAYVSAKDKYYVTPLEIAARNNNDPEVLRLLIQAGAVGDKDWALFRAAMDNKNPEVLRVLIQAGADVNALSYTPLMVAATYNDNHEVLRVLIQAGAYVNAKDNSGETPLMLAASNSKNKNPEVLRVLIQAGADVNAKNDKGETALILAVRGSVPEIVSLLLASGAAVSENDLELAQKNERLKNSAVIEELKSRLM